MGFLSNFNLNSNNTQNLNNLGANYSSSISNNSRGDYSSQISSPSNVLNSSAPGSTISGTIVDVKNQTAVIDIGGGNVVNARVEGSMNLVPGDTVTFEYKGTVSNQFVLSPLYTNMSSTSPVINALQDAGLPINDHNISIANSLMENGMGIDSKNLSEMVYLSKSYGSTDISDIIAMKKMGIEVNNENINSFINFKNYDSFISDEMSQITDSTIGVLSEMANSGNQSVAAQFLKDIISIFDLNLVNNDNPGADADVLKNLSDITNESIVQENSDSNGENIKTIISGGNDLALEANLINESQNEQFNVNDKLNGLAKFDNSDSGNTQISNALLSDEEVINSEVKGNNSFSLNLDNIQNLDTKNESNSIPQNSLNGQNNTLALENKGFLNALDMIKSNELSDSEISELIMSEKFQNSLKQGIMKSIHLEPDLVSDKNNVELLYKNLDKQLRNISDSLNNALKTTAANDNTVYPSVSILNTNLSSMNDNLEFMNQMNNMYQYVQIPLKMSGSETTGDLFVYANKRGKASLDGSVSALLHLDMENLGPMDVYASINNNKNVYTKFYLSSDEMIDFINDNIHILNERLEKRGYTLKAEVTEKPANSDRIDFINENDPMKSGTNALSNQKRLLKQYSFDMRA